MIIWRTRQPNSILPPALDGCAHWSRVELLPVGSHVIADDPLLLRPADTWHDVADGWQIGRRPVAGDHHCLLREGHHLPTLVVTDAQGQPWQVPAVLRPDAGCNLRLPVRQTGTRDDHGQPVPTWGRVPTPAQSRLLHIAQEARALIEAGDYHTLPLEAAATWSAELLAAVYHLTVADIAALGLLDDCLLSRIPAAAAGVPLPE